MYIDPDLVLNKENYKIIEANAVCSICSGIIISPVQCLDCENCFCELCIEDWKKKKGKDSCPFRCKNPNFKSSRTIKNLLSNLKFKCKNGCDKEIPYLDLEEHYNDTCSKIQIDYKKKYLEYKNKYLNLLNKYKELENKLNGNKLRGNNNNNNFNSKYHIHSLYKKLNEHNWRCNICFTFYKPNEEGRYRCEECDFDICLKCKLLEESGYKFKKIFLSKTHKHLLEAHYNSEFNWVCNICRKKYDKNTIKSYRCNKCDYDLCKFCKEKE